MASVGVYVALLLLLAGGTTRQGECLIDDGNNYVREACSVTRYPDVCIHSLASFSNAAKRNPRWWARAAVSVTLREAKCVAQYLAKLKKRGHLRGRSRVALADCIECFQDTIYNLHKSLGELRTLQSRTFERQMGDVETWMSATLTDEDTCLEGFGDQEGRQIRSSLSNRVLNVTYMTSNALALVTKLASVGITSNP
ncbi:PREDICTED: 21 kDa protein-like [Nelumbo nucifera]|uniref:21 kDa protein-like n=2 Tax=Nelumbo nucifera TaxID=4432 RepID=A0A1U8A403_NELNU|nr:PREDICTED: 21 kDa protein-like [Nelumbo nucifera]DAD38090.1 TPA_asm: hypothetical protein HUJ06_008731 [Nelumbo nucifera]